MKSLEKFSKGHNSANIWWTVKLRNLGSLDSNFNCISSEQLVVFIIYKKNIRKKIAGKSKSERKIRLIYIQNHGKRRFA